MGNKITNNIFSVGVLNPALRVFDVVMRTEFGTSYNSYIIKGCEKTALVEVCHASFFEYYLDNIKEVCDPAEIDYIVLNHCEPDHSGALRKMLELCPKAKVVVSRAGSIYLKGITNLTDFRVVIAKDGDIIDLGERELKFISAPFLHWPDSMFTWCEQEKALFSCDFFGCHYCEPNLFDIHMTYDKSYEKELKNYFDGIFGPFLSYVRAGLEKIADLDIKINLNSHGPVLTKNGKLPYVMKMYKQWSMLKQSDTKKIPIFYCSAYGNTGKIANALRGGVKSVLSDAEVKIYDINEYDIAFLSSELMQSDAFMIGSPTINADAVPPVWVLLSHVDAINIKKRPAFVFGSFGWSGEAVPNIITRLENLKVKVFGEGFKVNFVPTDEDLEKAEQQGKEFAQMLIKE